MNQNIVHSVFIVDDDVDDRESIRDAFIENQHHQNFTFMVSGDQLLLHFTEQPDVRNPSLILLDLNMPGKGGNDVLKEIKSSDSLRTIPVIILTTSSAEKDKEISYERGANCFLTKPDSYTELLAMTDSIAKLWLGENTPE